MISFAILSCAILAAASASVLAPFGRTAVIQGPSASARLVGSDGGAFVAGTPGGKITAEESFGYYSAPAAAVYSAPVVTKSFVPSPAVYYSSPAVATQFVAKTYSAPGFVSTPFVAKTYAAPAVAKTFVAPGLEGQYVPDNTEKLSDDGAYKPDNSDKLYDDGAYKAASVLVAAPLVAKTPVAVASVPVAESTVLAAGYGLEGQYVPDNTEKLSDDGSYKFDSTDKLYNDGSYKAAPLVASSVLAAGSELEGQYIPDNTEKLSDDGSYKHDVNDKLYDDGSYRAVSLASGAYAVPAVASAPVVAKALVASPVLTIGSEFEGQYVPDNTEKLSDDGSYKADITEKHYDDGSYRAAPLVAKTYAVPAVVSAPFVAANTVVASPGFGFEGRYVPVSAEKYYDDGSYKGAPFVSRTYSAPALFPAPAAAATYVAASPVVHSGYPVLAHGSGFEGHYFAYNTEKLSDDGSYKPDVNEKLYDDGAYRGETASW